MTDDNEFINQQTILVSELLIKVSALEAALLNRKLISKDDIAAETKIVVNKLTSIVNDNLKEGN